MPTRRRSRSRRRSWAGMLMSFAALAIALFLAATPLLEIWLPVDSPLALQLDTVRSWLMEWLVALWVATLGGMIGSFVNVVVWRMPRGVSVITGGSACPWCRSKIRLADNIPVLGWIRLRGRCRVCRLPISPRYPIVEAIFALAFLALHLAELQSGAANLPGGTRYAATGAVQMVVDTRWDVVAVAVFHALLFSLLMTWALMELDGSRLPVRTIAVAIVAGFAAPLAWPWLQPVAWSESELITAPGSLASRLATGFTGMAGGFLVGEFLRLVRAPDKPAHGYLPVCLMTTGLFLGWQATATALLLYALIRIALRSAPGLREARIPDCGCLALAVLVQICAWRWIDGVAGGAWLRDLRFLSVAAVATTLVACTKGGGQMER